MKKRCILVSLLATTMILGGCGSQAAESQALTESTGKATVSIGTESTEIEEMEVEKNKEETAPSEEGKEPEIEFESVNIGDTIKTDFVEMSVDMIKQAKKLEDLDEEASEGTYNRDKENYMYDESKTYICISGNLKNVGTEAYCILNMKGVFTFDDKYKYTATVGILEIEPIKKGVNQIFLPSSANPYNVSDSTVEPFESMRYYIVALVPDELINSYSTCKVDFGFHNNFTDTMSYIGDPVVGLIPDKEDDWDVIENRYFIFAEK